MRKRLGPDDEHRGLTPEEKELNELLGLDQQLIVLNEAQQSDDKLCKELLENNIADLPEDEISRRHNEITSIKKRMQERAEQIKRLRGTIEKQRQKRSTRNQRNKNSQQPKTSDKEYAI